MTMTTRKMIEIAGQKRDKELQAIADRYNAEVKKEMKKKKLKNELNFRINCLKGFVTGKM